MAVLRKALASDSMIELMPPRRGLILKALKLKAGLGTLLEKCNSLQSEVVAILAVRTLPLSGALQVRTGTARHSHVLAYTDGVDLCTYHALGRYGHTLWGAPISPHLDGVPAVLSVSRQDDKDHIRAIRSAPNLRTEGSIFECLCILLAWRRPRFR